ncbi:ABC transporter permease [Calothrix sp. 336/3]|uniref:ABC transporter permease n=1 Tax=Calothrix sp. 336/3 TaxID=1337936 RepID=UPI0004E29EBB|nr:iron export ABC transporter permease subunit FetB [Calothrix sp. 336/3]AKG24273.1 membrane protein [Calothrix sp. 336/3]
MSELIKLDIIDLISALGFILAAVALSLWAKIGLELNILVAVGRSLLQLAVLGYLLDFTFALNHPVAVVGFLLTLLTFAAIATKNRISAKLPLLPWVWGSLIFSTILTLIYTNYVILQPERWYAPRYLIPLFGLILANAMSAAAIAGERLVSTISSNQAEIETHLCLGATPQQAVSRYRKDAIRAGVIPTLNQMMIIAMVAIPEFTTGQLLSGINPLDAASYQILVLLMIVFSNILTTILLTQGVSQQFFNSAAQLKNKV